jgi:hypothetical protein
MTDTKYKKVGTSYWVDLKTEMYQQDTVGAAKDVMRHINKKGKIQFDVNDYDLLQPIVSLIESGIDPIKLRKVVSLKALDKFFVDNNLISPMLFRNRAKVKIYLAEVDDYEQ